MAWQPLRDPARIRAFCARDPGRYLFHLGDLDPAEWPHAEYLAWEEPAAGPGAAPAALASPAAPSTPAALLLLYRGLSVPALIAFGDEGALGERFAAALPLLPPAGFIHAFAEDLSLLERVRRVERHGAMRRMLWTGFPGGATPPAAARARRLGPADLPQLASLYAESYPEAYFEPVQLERGMFFGVETGGTLASVAGVHVYSAAEGVAMLGNIATRPAWRGQGLGRAVTAALVAALAPRVRHIGLNVRADNAPALRLYERLGFRTELVYEEARFAALDSSGSRCHSR